MLNFILLAGKICESLDLVTLVVNCQFTRK